MFEAWIIDPARVVRMALRMTAATSGASGVLALWSK
jgi:hypothetical protein